VDLLIVDARQRFSSVASLWPQGPPTEPVEWWLRIGRSASAKALHRFAFFIRGE
jgi:hypothetical protein